MPYYRITFEGYQEGEYENEEAAKQAFIDFIENDEIDVYGRDWRDHIAVEDLGDE